MKRFFLTETFWLMLILPLALGILIFPPMETQSFKQVIIDNQGLTGASYKNFYDLINQLSPGSAKVNRRPLLTPDSLAKTDVFFILSPRRPVSRQEAKNLTLFMKDGGTVYASFHDEVTYENLKQVFQQAEEPIPPPKKIDSFVNGKVTEFQALESPFVIGDQFAIYASHAMNEQGCYTSPCVFRSFQIEKGALYVFSGLPPFVDGLLSRSNNSNFAVQLAQTSAEKKMLFDEYHLFRSAASWTELLTDLKIVLPLFSLCLGVLFYFLFSGQTLKVHSATQRLRNTKTHHELNQDFLRTGLDKEKVLREAVEYHQSYVQRKIGIETHLSPDQPLIQQAKNLIQRHQQALTERNEFK